MSYPDWNNCGVPAPGDTVVIEDAITYCRFDSSKFDACLKRAHEAVKMDMERIAHARGRKEARRRRRCGRAIR